MERSIRIILFHNVMDRMPDRWRFIAWVSIVVTCVYVLALRLQLSVTTLKIVVEAKIAYWPETSRVGHDAVEISYGRLSWV